ncbi:type IV pilus secretin PilQ [Burkholderiaceae bacterium DAT-1]|nr:type IV pilus secretin PilQ [Burkholderiaceae bacterium DAT-1]
MMKQIKSAWFAYIVMAMSALFTHADDTNAIKSVDIKTDNNDRQIVIVTMQNPVKLPASFSVNTPPRIALDFVNTNNETGKSAIPVSSPNIRNINLAEANGRTRLVLNLVNSVGYETRVDNNRLFVVLEKPAGPSVVASDTTHFSQSLNAQKETVKSVDFRRGTSGEGRIIVDLSSPKIGIDIRQQGKDLVLEFAKTSVPHQLERRMDVSDFGTPVQAIDTYSRGETVKMVVSPKGNWEHSAYQTDNRFIVEIKNLDEQAKRLDLLEKPVYKGEKITFNMQDIEVRSLLQLIANENGKNVITSDTVKGSVTLRMKDVPWDQALDIIMMSKGLAKRESGNVIWIAPAEEISAREQTSLEAKRKLADVEPVRTETFPLSFLKADEVRALLSGDKQSLMSKNGSVTVEPRNNLLIVTDTASKLEEIRKLINKTDVPPRQVLIEARIVIADNSFSRQLGVRLGTALDRTLTKNGATQIGIGNDIGSSLAIAKNGVTAQPSMPATATPSINLPVSGASPATIGLSVLNANSGGLLSLELQALEAEGLGKTVSSPRVVTADKQKALISQGDKFYVIVPSPTGGTNGAQEKTAELKLEVTPRISPSGDIFMELNVTKDALTASGQYPVVATKQVNTNVLVENGGTAVLGGIYELTETDTVAKVPLLGDLPVVGNLFKSKSKTTKKTELLIFITPRVLDSALSAR